MYALMSCSKFNDNTLRIVDVGSCTKAQSIVEMIGPRECPLCGPCSHVELGWRGYYSVHGTFNSMEEATFHGGLIYDDGTYVIRSIVKRHEGKEDVWAPLYWNSKRGWGDIFAAERFSPFEVQSIDGPADSAYHRFAFEVPEEFKKYLPPEPVAAWED